MPCATVDEKREVGSGEGEAKDRERDGGTNERSEETSETSIRVSSGAWFLSI